MTRKTVYISVGLDDQNFTISRELDVEWEGYPEPELLELLDLAYQDARNGIQNVTPKAPF